MDSWLQPMTMDDKIKRLSNKKFKMIIPQSNDNMTILVIFSCSIVQA